MVLFRKFPKWSQLIEDNEVFKSNRSIGYKSYERTCSTYRNLYEQRRGEVGQTMWSVRCINYSGDVNWRWWYSGSAPKTDQHNDKRMNGIRQIILGIFIINSIYELRHQHNIQKWSHNWVNYYQIQAHLALIESEVASEATKCERHSCVCSNCENSFVVFVQWALLELELESSLKRSLQHIGLRLLCLFCNGNAEAETEKVEGLMHYAYYRYFFPGISDNRFWRT